MWNQLTTDSSATSAVTLTFCLGKVVGTSEAIDYLEENGYSALALVARHAKGDWGDLCEEDCAMNRQAIIHGGRIFSAYIVAGEKVYIITDEDRTHTTIMRASEY